MLSVDTTRRWLFLIAAVAALWACGVAATGGFAFRTAWLRISSQTAADPALLAVALAASAVTLTWRRGKRQEATALLILLTVLGAGLVVWQWLEARPLWLDEEMVALNFRDRSIVMLSGPLWLEQSAPLGWLILQRIALLGFGTHELAVRLIPSSFGVATVVCSAWIGHRWLTPIGATAFVLVCSFGQWLSFYSVELKHYSADTFFGLLLPALTVVVAEADSQRGARRALLAWLIAAVLGHWLSVGAALVLPACGIFLAVTFSRRRNVEMLRLLVGIGLIVVGSFSAHYVLALRFARESRFLGEFWAFAFPPIGSGLSGAIEWFSTQLQPFAMKPGGTGFWLSFWITAAIGYAVARSWRLGLIGAAVALSGFVLTALRIVPFYERLSLWFLPSVYLGIALFADSAVHLISSANVRSRSTRLVASFAVAAIAYQLCADMVRRCIDDLRLARPADMNRYVDDRSAVDWLMAQRQAGDVVVTTRFGAPALWWYGHLPISGTLPGGRPIYIAEAATDADCTTNLRASLGDASRALVYFGFEDYPKWLDDVALHELAKSGTVNDVQHFGPLSRAAVVDFTSIERDVTAEWRDARTPGEHDSCMALRIAEPW